MIIIWNKRLLSVACWLLKMNEKAAFVAKEVLKEAQERKVIMA